MAVTQFNGVAGDIGGNTRRIVQSIDRAKEAGTGLVVFPEQAITGYPVQDLLFLSGFVEDNMEALEQIALSTTGLAAIVGFIDRDKGSPAGNLYNAAAVLVNGRVERVIHKQLLPNYDVFDELRYFTPGKASSPVEIAGIPMGVVICEDLWDDDYEVKVVAGLASAGARAIIAINASPYHKEKPQMREKLIKERATKYGIPVLYVNMVGGQDEITFDGCSFATGPDGSIVFRAPQFEESMYFLQLNGAGGIEPLDPNPVAPLPSRPKELFKALALNLHDYYTKTGIFKGILLGLSGGLDSAFTAAVAADAIGGERVTCIYMPTRFSSEDSRTYSRLLCENLRCKFIEFSIEDIFSFFEERLGEAIPGNQFDIADENLQARIRADILMYYSNKFGLLLVSTGNKSEISTGYCTLYGDTCGGKNVPGDLYKTELARTCIEHVNKEREVIPRFIIERPPSAELKENQLDEDSLPPYKVLDEILVPLVEGFKSPGELVAMGHDEHIVRKVVGLVKNSEFKRAQLPQTIKVSKKAFGIGRRMPIVNGYDCRLKR